MPAGQIGDVLAYRRVSGGIAVRTAGDPGALVPFIRETVHQLEPGSPLFNEMRLDDRLDRTFVPARFYTTVLTVFAALSLSMAILGVYGLLSYSVEMRQREFAVRLALGADGREIASLVVRHSAVTTAVGLTIGLFAAAVGAGAMRGLLFGIQPVDAASFIGAALLIAAAAVVAAWRPGRKALAADPARALRVE